MRRFMKEACGSMISELAIDWRIDMKKALLSDKDRLAPDFRTYSQSPAFHYFAAGKA